METLRKYKEVDQKHPQITWEVEIRQEDDCDLSWLGEFYHTLSRRKRYPTIYVDLARHVLVLREREDYLYEDEIANYGDDVEDELDYEDHSYLLPDKLFLWRLRNKFWSNWDSAKRFCSIDPFEMMPDRDYMPGVKVDVEFYEAQFRYMNPDTNYWVPAWDEATYFPDGYSDKFPLTQANMDGLNRMIQDFQLHAAIVTGDSVCCYIEVRAWIDEMEMSMSGVGGVVVDSLDDEHIKQQIDELKGELRDELKEGAEGRMDSLAKFLIDLTDELDEREE